MLSQKKLNDLDQQAREAELSRQPNMLIPTRDVVGLLDTIAELLTVNNESKRLLEHTAVEVLRYLRGDQINVKNLYR